METDREPQGRGEENPKRSFGSALDDVDFKPLGRRVVVKRGVDGPPLRISRNDDGEKER
jgi:hypothetical protein